LSFIDIVLFVKEDIYYHHDKKSSLSSFAYGIFLFFQWGFKEIV